MAERTRCPNCGEEMPLNAPQGLCPACLLRQGMESASIGSAPSEAAIPPDPDATTGFAPGAPPGGGDGSVEAGVHVRYFGDYELIRELGRGGMGVVWKARQHSLNRPVALKLLKSDFLASDDERRRFQNEAEAVALLDHPHIVPIYEVGDHEGHQYFSMKLVGGPSLEKKLVDFAADPKAAARLVKTAAEAVHHAHQRGILHRDLKPSNILLDDRGEPYVTDFGLAKRVEGDSELTVSGAILGTPSYMAPEQASGRRGTVTTASDVYGLGAILYSLLTGRPPFLGESVVEILELVREQEPEPPSKLNPRTPRDLEIICLKCLAKEPRRRYGSAQALAEDLGRYVSGEPITARPVTRFERAVMWTRRKPAIASLLGLVVVVALAGLGGVLWQWRSAIDARNTADTRAQDALAAKVKESEAREAAVKAADVAKAQTVLAENATRQAKAQTKVATSRQLAALSVAQRDKRFDRSLLLAVEAFRTEKTYEARESIYQALQQRPGLTTFLHINKSGPLSVAFSPDGKTIAAGCSDGGVVLWDVAARKRLGDEPLPVTEGTVWSVAFSRDGKTIAAGYGFGPGSGLAGSGGGVVLWDVATRNRLGDEPRPVTEGWVESVAFSPDGRTIAAGYSAGDGGVVLWDVAARKRLVDEPLPVTEGCVSSVAFSPDAKTVAAGYFVQGGTGSDSGVVLWDVATRTRLGDEPLSVKEGWVFSVAFSPDGKTIAAGYYVVFHDVGGVVLWDVARRSRLVDEPLSVKEGNVRSVAFSPDGKTIAAGYEFDFIRGGVVLWDVAAGKRLVDEQLAVNEGGVRSVAFSPDGKTIAAGFAAGDGSAVVLWEAPARKRLRDEPLSVAEGHVCGAAFSPDGKTIAAGYFGDPGGGGFGGVVLWDLSARKRLGDEPLSVKEGGLRSLAFSPDGKTIAAGYSVIGTVRRGGVALWDVATRKRLGDEPLSVTEGEVCSAAFSPDGKTIAVGYLGNPDGDSFSGVVLWDVAARKRLGDDPLSVKEGGVQSLAFSPDGKSIAVGYSRGDSFGGAVLWDVSARKRSGDLPLPVTDGDVASVAFSPDGKTIAAGYTSGLDGGVVLWDIPTRKALDDEPLFVKEGRVDSVVFSPDGDTIAAGYSTMGNVRSGGVMLWDVATRKRLGDEPLSVTKGWVASVAFSPDGKTIAAGYDSELGVRGSGGVVMWDVDLESWQRRAGLIANRNFTREEWRDYFPDTPYRSTFPDFPVPPELKPK